MYDAPTPIVALEHEQAVLGAILRDGSPMFAKIQHSVTRDDFSEEIHRQIFDLAARLHAEGQSPTIVAVIPWLPEIMVGDEPIRPYLARLTGHMAASSATVLSMAANVREFADRRRVFDIAAQLQQAAASGVIERKAADMAGESIAALDMIATRNAPDVMRRVNIGDAGRSAYAQAMERRSGQGVVGVKTGISEIDDLIGSLRPRDSSVLAGRSSMGKTAMLTQIALNVAASGAGVLVFSLEMSADPLAQRALSLLTDHAGCPVPYSRIERGLFNDREARAIEAASVQLDGLGPFLEIEQQRTLTAQQIVSRSRQVRQLFEARGVKLGLIAVDHIGKVSPSGRYAGNRVMEVSEMSATLRAMAQELDAHSMLLAQISRQVEARENKRPMLSDLRESGSLEQDHDLVMGLYRPAYYLRKQGTPEAEAEADRVRHVLEVGVLKQRNGPEGIATLHADMATNRITSPDWSQDAPASPPLKPSYLRAAADNTGEGRL